ncbi:L-Aspartase-like protein [Schizothecium vesticola]|uniref:L-Aspartase-like protein n=1 Tax=Schizothecium vesticola TaxID=314040 RepID=A0AA40EH92_9PEZI|nr:L-Aspartase-like protein [Schizothecium vesticola]
MDSPHARAVFDEWLALKVNREDGEIPPVDGQSLTIADVIAVSCHRTQARLSDEPSVQQQVQDSVDFLQKKLADGTVIYGVTTGFGGSADTRTRDYERLQSAAIQHLNVGVLLEVDKGQTPLDNELLRSHALPPPIVRAAMLIRCNSLMRGHSGVRVDVIQAIMRLLSRDMIPVVPLRGSISASGDLSTLSYIAGTLEGNPDIFVKVGASNKIIPADQALPLAGLSPVRLQAKEGLGITNGTAPSCAAAAIVMHQANQLALLTQLLTAVGTEALYGTVRNYHPFISAVRPHDGQAEAAANIVNFLTESYMLVLGRDANYEGLAQDRYALRTAPQWIGPQLEDLLLATRQVTTELNSTTDNPLIDAVNGHIHHGGNFQAMAITSAMEKTMLALQNLGRLLFAQSSELINNTTNNGLPPNLCADEPSTSFTFKGFDVNMAAYMAELAYLARPISSHVQVAEMTNQSVNSMALVAARYALEAVEVLSLMAATYILALCQALDLRYQQRRFASSMKCELSQYGNRLSPHPNSEVEAVFSKAARSASLRWDELSHMDTPDRSAAVAKHFIGEIVDDMARICPQLTASDLATSAKEICDTLVEKFETERRVTGTDGCYGFLSLGSRLVYEFVRVELAIPLNRGVVDHPPLMRHAARGQEGVFRNSAANADSDPNDGPESWRHGKILGTMAGKIYEAIRDGRLNDRIMKLSMDQDLWTDAN